MPVYSSRLRPWRRGCFLKRALSRLNPKSRASSRISGEERRKGEKRTTDRSFRTLRPREIFKREQSTSKTLTSSKETTLQVNPSALLNSQEDTGCNDGHGNGKNNKRSPEWPPDYRVFRKFSSLGRNERFKDGRAKNLSPSRECYGFEKRGSESGHEVNREGLC